MDPTFAVDLTSAALVTGATDITGLLQLAQGIGTAVEQGNYWWIISTVVFCLVEVAKGNIPGTKIQIPKLPVLFPDTMPPQAMKTLVMVASGAVAAIFAFSGRPMDKVVADFAVGWIGAMGLHEAVDTVKPLLGMVTKLTPKKKA